jgi:hypothetical protein
MDADFFLFLLSRTLRNEAGLDRYNRRPWSCLYLKHAPRFIQNSERTRFAETVAEALSIPSVAELKKLLAERGPELARLFGNGWWDYPTERSDIDRIGTR